jgi:hypothetical protein
MGETNRKYEAGNCGQTGDSEIQTHEILLCKNGAKSTLTSVPHLLIYAEGTSFVPVDPVFIHGDGGGNTLKNRVPHPFRVFLRNGWETTTVTSRLYLIPDP